MSNCKHNVITKRPDGGHKCLECDYEFIGWDAEPPQVWIDAKKREKLIKENFTGQALEDLLGTKPDSPSQNGEKCKFDNYHCDDVAAGRPCTCPMQWCTCKPEGTPKGELKEAYDKGYAQGNADADNVMYSGLQTHEREINELKKELAAMRAEGENAYVEEFEFREAMLTYVEMRFMCTKDTALCKECKGFTADLRRLFCTSPRPADSRE